jgi:hypothetical protein
MRAKAPSPLRFAGAVQDAGGIAGRGRIAQSVMESVPGAAELIRLIPGGEFG